MLRLRSAAERFRLGGEVVIEKWLVLWKDEETICIYYIIIIYYILYIIYIYMKYGCVEDGGLLKIGGILMIVEDC